MAQSSDTQTGTVCELLPNLQYRVELHTTNEKVICYPSGKIKLNKIRILVGDKVSVIMDPYGGKATNRIIRRLA